MILHKIMPITCSIARKTALMYQTFSYAEDFLRKLLLPQDEALIGHRAKDEL